MAQTFELQAQNRAHFGKAITRRMRRLHNHIPAVIYGAGLDTTSITLNHNEVAKALQHEAFYSHILTMHVDGKAEKVVVKAIQRHPYKPVVMHMDFLRVKANEKLHMHIPLHYLNEEKAPGVKDAGVVTHHLSDVEVVCLPANLPEFIEVDLANLGMNESIHLSGLKMPKGVEIVALTQAEPNDLSVVSIHPPRVQEEPETPVTEITEEKSEEEIAAEAAAASEEKEEGKDKE